MQNQPTKRHTDVAIPEIITQGGKTNADSSK